MKYDLSKMTVWGVIDLGNRIYPTPPLYIANLSNLQFSDRAARYTYQVHEDSHILEVEERSSEGKTLYEITTSKPLSFNELAAIANSSNLCSSVPESAVYALTQFGAGEITITKVSAM
jgi:hypothetical protein